MIFNNLPELSYQKLTIIIIFIGELEVLLIT